MSEAEAIRRLTARWKEQVALFPELRIEMPLLVYISRNIVTVHRNNLLPQATVRLGARHGRI
jgi:hypothetical protein